MIRRALLSGAVATLGLTACLPEDFGGNFTIVNETHQPVFFSASRIPGDGGTYDYGIKGCGRPGLRLYDEAGQVLVRVDVKWCEGQVLTVLGPDEYTLKSASG